MLASTSTPSTASTPPSSHAAEDILSRARRLSNNAFERTHPPSFAEGEESYRPRSSSSLSSHHYHSQHNSFDALANIRRSSQKKRQSTSSNIVLRDESPQHDQLGITPVISEPLSISTTTTSTSRASTGMTMSLVQSPVEDESSNNNSSSIHSGDLNHSPDTFLDPNRAQNSSSCATSLTESTSLSASSSSALTCAPSSPSSLSSVLSTRPRALTSGGVGDGKLMVDPQSLGHRKHQSENGGSSLVYGILAMLRQQTDLESPLVRPKVDYPYQEGGQEEPTAAGTTLSQTPTTTTSSSSVDAQEGDLHKAQTTANEGIALNHAPAPMVRSGVEGPVTDETRQDVPTNGSKDETKGQTDSATPDHPNVAVTQTTHESVPYSPKEQDSIKGAVAQDEESSSVLHTSTSTTKDDPSLPNPSSAAKTTMPTAATAKNSFLHKMGVRKTSFSETALASSTQDNSDTSSIKSHNTQLSSTSSKLNKKRSTKFLGKLVPKFLQTSLSPNLAGQVTEGGGGRLSPTSTRSSRSGSTSSQGPLNKPQGLHSDSSSSLDELVDASASILALSFTRESQESLALPEVDEVEEEDDEESEDEKEVEGVMELEMSAPTNPEYLKNLQSGDSATMTRRSSCSSTSDKVTTTGTEKATNAITTEASKKESSVAPVCNFEVEYQEEDLEEESVQEQKEPKGKLEALKIEIQTKTVEEPPLSPYIIDENCDDDFFLNSVLRKRSGSQVQQTESNRPQPLQQQHLRYQSPQRYSSSPSIMSSSHPSDSTLCSVRSSTPTLSGWSSGHSSSSQASTPSPTSPLTLNGQVYPFPTMMKVNTQKSATMNVSAGTGAKHQTMHMHYRTNPLPAPIMVGHDEKRSRLRDAVGEWRRATDASN